LIVIEQLEELYLTLRVSRQLGIAPHLGVRAKLGTKGDGPLGMFHGRPGKIRFNRPGNPDGGDGIRTSGDVRLSATPATIISGRKSPLLA
jgi:hypothetical protein